MTTQPQDHDAGVNGSIETYDDENGNVVMYDTANPLAWLAADPEYVYEVGDGREGR